MELIIKYLNNLIEVDWLPGGCIMHSNENLHKFDYFPLKEKHIVRILFILLF